MSTFGFKLLKVIFGFCTPMLGGLILPVIGGVNCTSVGTFAFGSGFKFTGLADMLIVGTPSSV